MLEGVVQGVVVEVFASVEERKVVVEEKVDDQEEQVEPQVVVLEALNHPLVAFPYFQGVAEAYQEAWEA